MRDSTTIEELYQKLLEDLNFCISLQKQSRQSNGPYFSLPFWASLRSHVSTDIYNKAISKQQVVYYQGDKDLNLMFIQDYWYIMSSSKEHELR